MIEKIPGCVNSAGKVMGTMFWAHNGALLGDFMYQGTTTNAGAYCVTLERFRAAMKYVKMLWTAYKMCFA
jgi:hypothetical protein